MHSKDVRFQFDCVRCWKEVLQGIGGWVVLIALAIGIGLVVYFVGDRDEVRSDPPLVREGMTAPQESRSGD